MVLAIAKKKDRLKENIPFMETKYRPQLAKRKLHGQTKLLDKQIKITQEADTHSLQWKTKDKNESYILYFWTRQTPICLAVYDLYSQSSLIFPILPLNNQPNNQAEGSFKIVDVME